MNSVHFAQPQARLKAECVSGQEKALAQTTPEPFRNQLNFQSNLTNLPLETQPPKCGRCGKKAGELHLVAKQAHPSQPVTVVRLCASCRGNAYAVTFVQPQACAECGDSLRDSVSIHTKESQTVCETCFRYRPQKRHGEQAVHFHLMSIGG